MRGSMTSSGPCSHKLSTWTPCNPARQKLAELWEVARAMQEPLASRGVRTSEHAASGGFCRTRLWCRSRPGPCADLPLLLLILGFLVGSSCNAFVLNSCLQAKTTVRGRRAGPAFRETCMLAPSALPVTIDRCPLVGYIQSRHVQSIEKHPDAATDGALYMYGQLIRGWKYSMCQLARLRDCSGSAARYSRRSIHGA